MPAFLGIFHIAHDSIMSQKTLCAFICLFVTGCVAVAHFRGRDGPNVVFGRRWGAALQQPTTPVEPVAATAAAAPQVPPLDASLSDLIARLPKAELHIHIEGTLEADMMMAFAARNNVSMPYANVAEAQAAR